MASATLSAFLRSLLGDVSTIVDVLSLILPFLGIGIRASPQSANGRCATLVLLPIMPSKLSIMARTKTSMIRSHCPHEPQQKSFSPLFPSPAALPWLAKRRLSSGRMFVRTCPLFFAPTPIFDCAHSILRRKAKMSLKSSTTLKLLLRGLR